MFDIGFLELMLIGIVSLVVIGPERLPDVARTAGTWINKAQRFVRGVKSDLASELKSGELKDLLGDQRKQIAELRQMVQSTKRELEQSTAEVVRDAKSTFDELEESAADAGIVKPRHGVNRTFPSGQSAASGAAEPDASTAGAPGVEPHGAGTAGDLAGQVAGTSGQGSSTVPLASDAVSEPVDTGPQPGSWASGIVRPDDRDGGETDAGVQTEQRTEVTSEGGRGEGVNPDATQDSATGTDR